MSSDIPGSGKGRYIIRSEDASRLAEVIKEISGDPGITVADSIGPPGQPHTLVVEMSHEKARSLEQRLRSTDQIKIEPDSPLSLFARRNDPGMEGMHMAKGPESGGSNPSENIQPNVEGASSSSSGTAKTQTQTRTAGAPAASSRPGKIIARRKGQYLIALRRQTAMQPMGLQPLTFAFVEQTLQSNPDIEVVDTVGPRNILGALADGLMGEAPTVLVARMSEEKANVLHQQAQGRLIVERDQDLALLDPAFQPPMLVSGAMPTAGPVFSAVVMVVGQDNAPIKDAEVYLFGSFLPASGVTDERGVATVTLFGETARSIRSLYVKPRCDYWSFYQTQPDISADEANIVALRPLSDSASLPNFPKQQVLGWGQKAMRLDQLPGNYRGQGIKIGIIDSGAATTHDDLKKIRSGFDVINKKTHPNTWNEDTIAHGSHCAGVIAGADNMAGVRGFAPDAEVHACKLFPGGQVSQLIDALEYCIEKQIDVVNLSLGGAAPSEALEQQILRAKRLGVACIVAAGNSGGAVQYPASSPNVLAVSAIGKLDEFPADSYHTQTVMPQVDGNGFFPARFSCHGPEIAVCGPGVAIVSCVPSNNYAVWDGTSMAAPHITGLAALVLAHHPDFQTAFKARNAERVERLFQIIRLSARRVNLGDPARTGYGLPDAPVAVGLQQKAGQAVQPNVYGPLMHPLSAGYPDQVQLASQMWTSNPWGQLSPASAAVMAGYPGGGIDQTFAAQYMPQVFGQPQFGFKLPQQVYGWQGW